MFMLFVEAGQTPFNMMGLSSSSVAGVPGAGNCLTVEQLQLMSHLAQQHQQQQRPVHPALEAMLGTHGQLLAGFMQQPPPVNNAAVKAQPQLRGTTQIFLHTTAVLYSESTTT